jgi:hypothetical protein
MTRRKKLVLSRETLRKLSQTRLQEVKGGVSDLEAECERYYTNLGCPTVPTCNCSSPETCGGEMSFRIPC